eukprot:CAMPEP_0172321842 /NCGR_PEP_ID=MMETSP1058-20130122/44451_1 /TAXON_ID=83371 /ORGANISM="Detonula confervacea, Strain CCMP 353" /LENGTH=430 /DNA_ID=CAMNT_0013037449 /DNA_START=77 /DNA_END=1369 /DNA_ORIENTATION=-
MSSTKKQMFEGVGAPINVAQIDGNIDPTLDSCCQREIESNRKRDAVETQLRKHDRVTQAENQRRQHQPSVPFGGSGYNYNAYNLIHGLSFGSGCRCCYDPNGDGGEYELLAEAKKERGIIDAGMDNNVDAEEVEEDAKEIRRDGENSDSDSDGEFDYLLDEDVPGGAPSSENDGLQAQRRAELENMAHHYEVARHHGYGVHRQMHPQRVFTAAGYGAHQVRDKVCPKGAVLHLYDAYSPLSASLDICLEGMARRYAGTKFVRGLGITSCLYAEDGGAEWKKGDYPMLLALRDGRVAAWSSGLCDFYRDKGSEEVESKVVEQWLDRAGVLHDNAPPVDTLCRIRPEEEMLLENMRKLNNLGGGSGMLGGMGGEMGRKKGITLNNREDLEEERFECGVAGCNKSFSHEHVGVKNEAQDGLLVSESQVASSTD